VLYLGSAGLVWSRRHRPAAWLLGPAVLGFLVANLFDWPWHVPASGAVFAVAVGARSDAGDAALGPMTDAVTLRPARLHAARRDSSRGAE
jgi:hypothetical protein